MNLSSIGAADAAWSAAPAATRRTPSSAPASPAEASEVAIAQGLSGLDDALEAGDLGKARSALNKVRSEAGLQGEAIPGEADPLSEISKSLKKDDLEGARRAWDAFRASVDDELPEDYSVTVTRTATFSILA